MYLLFFFAHGISKDLFYILIFVIGVFGGYWAVFVTVAAESFGTNLRATVATTVPNFVRGSLVPISALFAFLKISKGLYEAGIIVGAVCMLIAFFGIYKYKETYFKDLDYYES